MIGLSLLYALANRDIIDGTLTASRNPIFVQLSDGGIQNSYEIKISNKRHTPRLFTLTLDGLIGANLSSANLETIGGRSAIVAVDADSVRAVRITVKTPRFAINNEEMPFDIVIRDLAGGETTILNGSFISPSTAVTK